MQYYTYRHLVVWSLIVVVVVVVVVRVPAAVKEGAEVGGLAQRTVRHLVDDVVKDFHVLREREFLFGHIINSCECRICDEGEKEAENCAAQKHANEFLESGSPLFC